MQVLDVIRRANTEHEVKFLLFAYVETLPFYDFARSLPHGITKLPLAGMEDVRDRFEALLHIDLNAAQASAPAHAIIREAAEIFGTALTRLQILRERASVVSARDVELTF